MTKIGRNQPCPCGSGKKYKKCHGALIAPENIRKPLQEALNQSKVQRIQRQRQQGLAKPIVSGEFSGYRLVSVGNRLMFSKNWATFHEFLGDYIKDVMGADWGNAELAKPLEERHPILVWYNYLCNYQRAFIKVPGEVHSAPMIGAASAYLQLAYDLYSLANNAELQQKLINRIRDKDNFEGARYEVYVAATMIRAGFSLEFENEDDHSTSHCEFTATNTLTGKKFSVEAKRCANNSFRLGRQLNRALAKRANHTRVVFIDINIPDDVRNNDIYDKMDDALSRLRSFEGRVINGRPLPSAYLFVTNNPWHHHLEDTGIRRFVMIDGFQIPDFKGGKRFPTLREALEARDRHREMEYLLQSMQEHVEIPATFDGKIPDFAFGDNTHRLLIGQHYLVKKEDGTDIVGKLTSATVLEPESAAYCIFACEDGKTRIEKCPLSETEMEVWKRYPDTFFGDVQQRKTKLETGMELYDFILASYSNTQKDRLLEFMKEAEDIDKLRDLDQPALAKIYAERITANILARHPEQPPMRTPKVRRPKAKTQRGL